jgi:hypothetical protein
MKKTQSRVYRGVCIFAIDEQDENRNRNQQKIRRRVMTKM